MPSASKLDGATSQLIDCGPNRGRLRESETTLDQPTEGRFSEIRPSSDGITNSQWEFNLSVFTNGLHSAHSVYGSSQNSFNRSCAVGRFSNRACWVSLPAEMQGHLDAHSHDPLRDAGRHGNLKAAALSQTTWDVNLRATSEWFHELRATRFQHLFGRAVAGQAPAVSDKQRTCNGISPNCRNRVLATATLEFAQYYPCRNCRQPDDSAYMISGFAMRGVCLPDA